MPRAILLLAALTLLSAGSAQEPAKEPAKAKPSALDAAKEAYQKEVKQAGEALLKEFVAEEKRLRDTTKLKIDEKIKRAEQLEEEKQAFEADGKVPRSLGLKTATTDYQAAMTAAKTRAEKAFDAAAETAGRADLAAAKAILTEKAEFFKPAAGPLKPPAPVKPAPAPPATVPAAAPANPLVGTWIRPLRAGAMLKHVTPTHVTITHHDGEGKVTLTHGGRYSVKGQVIQEFIEYGVGNGWDALKGRSLTTTFKVEGKRLIQTARGRTQDEIWELVEPKDLPREAKP